MIDYTRINWKNEPNETTPLSAENLNKMDKAIDDLATDVNSLVPNPVDVPTEGLEKLAYGGTVYEVKGGHKIVDDSGTTLAQKDNMKFGGVYSHNSSTMTEVDIVREFNSVSDIEALTGESVKGFQYLDDDVYDSFTATDIAFDNTDTSFVGTNVQDVLEEVDTKISGLTAIVSDVFVSGDKLVDYPTGYDITNCIVIGLMYQAGTTRWDTLPNHNYATVNVSLRSDKIYVYNGVTALEGKTFRFALLKIS